MKNRLFLKGIIFGCTLFLFTTILVPLFEGDTLVFKNLLKGFLIFGVLGSLLYTLALRLIKK